MSAATLPMVLDAWRMVASHRHFEGVLPLSALPRLKQALLDAEGECRYELDFSRHPLGHQVLRVQVRAELPLQCQRSLERFLYPVRIDQDLGLVRDEAQEDSLPEGMEAVLVGEDGALHPADLIEDELLLAVPVVPIDPDAPELSPEWALAPEEKEEKPNPFAALAALKERH
jgi:uncharacterized protein